MIVGAYLVEHHAVGAYVQRSPCSKNGIRVIEETNARRWLGVCQQRGCLLLRKNRLEECNNAYPQNCTNHVQYRSVKVALGKTQREPENTENIRVSAT